MRRSFEEHLQRELEKNKGRVFTYKTNSLFRAVVKRAFCNRLHPNPEDEFSKPEVGPSYRIISEYEKKFRKEGEAELTESQEPIVVERMYPHGYMIINGHHRWAAYYRIGQKMVPVHVVNLTHEKDIAKMLEKAHNERRVALDLDEVVLCKDSGDASEELPHFPFNLFVKDRIRLGIPALINYLSNKGYDIWVYSSNFYSMDYIKFLFRFYHVSITGIVTGIAKDKSLFNANAQKNVTEMIVGKYNNTVHIDKEMVLNVNNRTKEYQDYSIKDPVNNWSQGVMDIIGELEDNA